MSRRFRMHRHGCLLCRVSSGIDLASPSELIAHNRDSRDIASHLGADEVIYQDLDDLVAACAELSTRDPKTQKFEVGVFCGSYTTDLPSGYFEHLNQVRGRKRKIHVVEETRGPPIRTANSGTTQISVTSPGGGSVALRPPSPALNGSTWESSPAGSDGLKAPSPHSPADREDIR